MIVLICQTITVERRTNDDFLICCEELPSLFCPLLTLGCIHWVEDTLGSRRTHLSFEGSIVLLLEGLCLRTPPCELIGIWMTAGAEAGAALPCALVAAVTRLVLRPTLLLLDSLRTMLFVPVSNTIKSLISLPSDNDCTFVCPSRLELRIKGS